MSHPESVAGGSDLAARLVSQSGDAIVICDVEGRIILWNSGAETVFGYSTSEALGQSLDIIIPERFRDRHWEGYRHTMASGVTRYADDVLAVPGQRKDGSRLSLEFKVTLLSGDDGRPEAIAAILRDVTVRWEAERNLRRELNELRAAGSSAP